MGRPATVENCRRRLAASAAKMTCMRRRRIILVAAAIVLVALSVGVAVRWRLQKISEAKESRRARRVEIMRRLMVLNEEQRNLKGGPRLHDVRSEWVELSHEQKILTEEDREAD